MRILSARRLLITLSSVVTLGALLAAFSAQTSAGIVRQLTDQKATRIGSPCLDDAGTKLYVNSSTNQLGGNPAHRFQIFSFDTVTGAAQQITNLSKGVSDYWAGTVSVSDDGQWLTFVSKSDPVGLNHDASLEVFVMRTDGTGIAQVTNDLSVDAADVTTAVLSGSANRIAFRSRANPFGTNPNNMDQLFAISFDGTGLRQLTAATTSANWYGLSISDDGQKIVFGTTANLTGGNSDRTCEVFAIQADGTNLRQLTSSTSTWSQYPVLSGNGSKIAFEGAGSEIWAINWDGTDLTPLTSAIGGHGSYNPSITDDGQYVFFSADATGNNNNEIWKVGFDGSGPMQVTTGTLTTRDSPVVAGGGGRVAFFEGPENYSGAPGDLDVVSGTGTNLRQLITAAAFDIEDPEITRDGTRIVFESNMNPFGTNPDGGYEIFRIQADGTGLAQVTNLAAGDALDPSIAADGNTIVFSSDADPTGQNPAGNVEIFLIQADGTGIRQLTHSSPLGTDEPLISANGMVVVYVTHDSGWGQINIAAVNADGTGQHNLTSGPSGRYSWKQRVDDAGTWISFMSTANLTGTSPNGLYQVYRIRTDGTGLQRISTDATRQAYYPEISGTGARIVYLSNADPAGSNPAHYTQVFVYDTSTSQTYQITAATGVGNAAFPAAISGDGNWVVWTATTPWAEPNPNYYLNLWRAPATGGGLERIGAIPPNPWVANLAPRPDMTGNHIVFDGWDDTTEQNPDHSYDLWLADMTKEPQIRVSKATPTLVSWDYEAGPIRYDVIRGDVANLGPGIAGTVDLGPVVCLENNSPDADTMGFEDPGLPPAGHAFFFVFRGSRGLNFGPGSWGQSSAGFERVPGTGVCAP